MATRDVVVVHVVEGGSRESPPIIFVIGSALNTDMHEVKSGDSFVSRSRHHQPSHDDNHLVERFCLSPIVLLLHVNLESTICHKLLKLTVISEHSLLDQHEQCTTPPWLMQLRSQSLRRYCACRLYRTGRSLF